MDVMPRGVTHGPTASKTHCAPRFNIGAPQRGFDVGLSAVLESHQSTSNDNVLLMLDHSGRTYRLASFGGPVEEDRIGRAFCSLD